MSDEFWRLYKNVERWALSSEVNDLIRDDVKTLYDYVKSQVGSSIAETLLSRGLISGTLYDEIKDVERLLDNLDAIDLDMIKANLIRILEILEQAYFSAVRVSKS
ncbi:MAG: hypothetical protein NO117_03915 [Sulfolobales archaeon]|nr:hypothetical protein [Sulfolobales archaeon]